MIDKDTGQVLRQVLLQVLLVEDNAGDAELITDLLDEGAVRPGAIRHVSTLAEASDYLQTATPDVVLLDLRLPDGAGVGCVEAIRSVASEVPIVVLTGMEDEALAMACIGAGAQDYLSKREVQAQSLRRALSHAIARSAARSQRRRADALQARLAAIVEASSDAIVSTTVDGVITSWNPGASRIFGYTSTETIGHRAVDRLPLLERDCEGRAQGDVSFDGPRERVFRRRDGAVLTVSVVASPLRDDAGAVVGVAAILRDITQQRGLETQLAFSDRMVAIGTLAAGVAHEINNPLAAVVANLQMARERLSRIDPNAAQPFASELAAELSDAQEGADRVTLIVRDLKLFSRAEDDRLGPVDLQRTLDSAIRLAGNELRHRARLVKDCAATPAVHANEARLGQVLLNLLMNAAQSIPEGKYDENEIRVATAVNAKGEVTLTVSDTGCGMPVDVQRRLFTAFFTTKPIGVGTGLGLAISQRIMTMFGGSITFDSEVGRGSRFVVALRPSTGGVPPQIAVEATEAPARRGRLLVIDDEPIVLRVLQRILSREHDLVATASAAQGLRLLREGNEYDLILCDLMMPQVSGAEFYEEVRRMTPGQERRVVFMTGGAFTPTARAFLDSVPNPQVSKPFDPAQVRAVVREALR